jgi:hypothetical protein
VPGTDDFAMTFTRETDGKAGGGVVATVLALLKTLHTTRGH